MPQTSVSQNPARAYAGQVAELCAPRYSRSACAEDVATQAILCGQPVLRGTDPDAQVRAVVDGDTVDASTLAGFVILSTSGQGDCDTGAFEISEGMALSIMRMGPMDLEVSAPVAAGNPVFVGNTTATLGQIADAAGAGLVQVDGARFMTSAAAGETAVAWLNL
jgi:hypothetical protein